jgi:hypothetical protein
LPHTLVNNHALLSCTTYAVPSYTFSKKFAGTRFQMG